MVYVIPFKDLSLTIVVGQLRAFSSVTLTAKRELTSRSNIIYQSSNLVRTQIIFDHELTYMYLLFDINYHLACCSGVCLCRGRLLLMCSHILSPKEESVNHGRGGDARSTSLDGIL